MGALSKLGSRLEPTSVRNKAERGYSLIEMAMIIVVIGLLLTTGMNIYVSVNRSVQDIETKTVLRSVDSSIEAFIKANARLPSSSEYNSVSGGLMDPYRQTLEYVGARGTRNGGNIMDLSSEDGMLCYFDITPLHLKICNNSDCSVFDTVEDVAYVILSTGLNRVVDVEHWPTDNDPNMTYYTSRERDGYGRVDDVVMYKTIREAKAHADCDEYNLKILTDAIPYLYTSDYASDWSGSAMTTDENIVYITASGGLQSDETPRSDGEFGYYYWCVIYDTYASSSGMEVIFEGNQADSSNNYRSCSWSRNNKRTGRVSLPIHGIKKLGSLSTLYVPVEFEIIVADESYMNDDLSHDATKNSSGYVSKKIRTYLVDDLSFP